MYMSATHDQVVNQFFAGFSWFSSHRYFAGWQWLEDEIRNASGGFCFGRASDVGGNIEGIHDQQGSPVALLIDEAKTIRDDVIDTLSRCHTTFRLFMSSTGQASGGFYRICTAQADRWRVFRVPSSECAHVSKAEIEADRENLKDSVFRIKHGAEWLYDAGDSMISLEHVRSLLADPPAAVKDGRRRGFCDFAGSGDESVLAVCEGNCARIVEAWRHYDTMNSVGKFLNLFRKLGLSSHQVGGDEGYGHALMDRMGEQGFFLKRINNGSPASKPNLYANLSAEWWSTVAELIEHRRVVIPCDEKLVAQLTSRQKLYDSKGRERLESKADMRARGLESPDRADALIGSIMLAFGMKGGAVTERDLAGIRFGGGQQLFSGEAVRFSEEAPSSDGVWDVSRIARYPFNMR